MSIEIEVSPEFHATAARLLREAGFELLQISGRTIVLAQGEASAAYSALAQLEAEAATDQFKSAKAEALSEAQRSAVELREGIAGSATLQRAIAWAVKMPYAMMWMAHEAAGADPTGPFAAIAAIARDAFQIEADITGETAEDVRDRALTMNADLFKATQRVEGMERLAETQIAAAETPEALGDAVSQIGALEAQIVTTLEQLND